LAFKKRDAFSSKTLPGMQNILRKTVPTEEGYLNPESWINLGFFMGIDNKWYEIDFGLTVSLNPYYESKRERINGEEEKGRGWMWGNDNDIYPNIQIRIGKENRAHFILNVLRGDYDLKYGVINAFLTMPFNDYFTLEVGGSLYQADSIFIAPKITYKGFSLKTKIGTILNYNFNQYYFGNTGVSIIDSLYTSTAISYEF